MQFKISKTKPLPTPQRKPGRPPKYPFDKMAVGDSFFIPGVEKRHSIFSCMNSYNSTFNKKIKLATRQATEKGVFGVRVWRIK